MSSSWLKFRVLLIRRAGVQVKEGAATTVSIQLSVANISETVTVSAALPAAAVAAPSQGSLTARSAQSLISAEYIQNYTSPISDYSQVLQMAPGTFSVAANGPGLGDTKTFFRGFKDGQYSMTYDSIPFNDTNDPTHHSWAFFPAQTIGSTVFDRSPGSAQTIGPSTYGGSVSLLSRSLNADRLLNGTISYGSFNTKLFDMDFNTGRFGSGGKQRFMFDLHDMRSDGYQTFNFQHRVAFSAKYNYQLSDNSSISAFTSIMHLSSNTPNQKGSTRAQYAQFGDNFLMTDNPNDPAVLQVQLLLDSDRLRVLRLQDAVRQRLVDRRQGLHDAVLQQAELQRRDHHLADQRHRQVEQLSQVRQQPAGDLRGQQRHLPHRPVVGIRLDGSLSDSVGSAHVGRRGAAQLPRAVRHDDAAAVCGVFVAGAVEPDDHARDQVLLLQAGPDAVRRQRQDRRQPERRGVRQPHRAVRRRGCPRSTRICSCSPTGRCTGSTARDRTSRPRASST